jgi:hypothetical protein
MSIVKRTSPKIGVYYINTTTGKRTTEASYKRSKSSAKIAKTQFKTAKGYACSKAGRDLVSKRTSSAGKRLRTC